MTKKQIGINLGESLVKKLDSLVAKSDGKFRSRSHAIEMLLREALEEPS